MKATTRKRLELLTFLIPGYSLIAGDKHGSKWTAGPWKKSPQDEIDASRHRRERAATSLDGPEGSA